MHAFFKNHVCSIKAMQPQKLLWWIPYNTSIKSGCFWPLPSPSSHQCPLKMQYQELGDPWEWKTMIKEGGVKLPPSAPVEGIHWRNSWRGRLAHLPFFSVTSNCFSSIWTPNPLALLKTDRGPKRETGGICMHQTLRLTVHRLQPNKLKICCSH